MKKIISICLVIILVICSAVPVFAVNSSSAKTQIGNGNISPMFVGISVMSTAIDIDWWGRASCSGTVTLSNDTYSVNLTVALQRYNGGNWTTVTSWSQNGYGGDGTDMEKYYYVTSGTYRVASTARVYNANGTLIETQTIYSGSQTY